MTIECPQCGNEDQAMIHGIDVRGVYDGVLVWYCQICGHMWPRFADGRPNADAVDWIKNALSRQSVVGEDV